MILSKTFLTDTPQDLEYKQYCVLAFQQRCNNEYEYQKIFPIINDVNFHYTNMNNFISQKKELERYNSKISKFNFEDLKVEYTTEIKDTFEEFEQLAEWSASIFKNLLENGKLIYNLIENQINIQLITKEKSDFGYLLFLSNPSKLYQYSIKSIITNETSWGINLEYIRDIKSKILTNINSDQPLWHIEYPEYLSLENSILPIVKRSIMKKHLELIK